MTSHFMLDSFPISGLMEEVKTISIQLHAFARKTRLSQRYKT
jgi:hypothetical protein